MIRSDAWDEKPEVHASTPEVQLMHEAEKQGDQHHFLPLSRPAPLPVGVAPPAKPYLTVGPRQHFARKAARRPSLLASPRRQSLIPPSGHANILPGRPRTGRPCWRCPAGKALIHRRATPTGHALLPKGPSFPEGPAGCSSTPFKLKFVGSRGTKSEKISLFLQLQPKIKIVSIKKQELSGGSINFLSSRTG